MFQNKKCTTYYYCPFSDVKTNSRWKSVYTAEELSKVKELVNGAAANNLTLVYGLRMPEGLSDLDEKCHTLVLSKFRQLKEINVTDFFIKRRWPCTPY